MDLDLQSTIESLVEHCRGNGWAGYDPYDALNSPLFRAIPLLDRRLPRLVLTQFLKRSPINFRPLLQIPKVQNAKGIALFLSALLMLNEKDEGRYVSDIEYMIARLKDLRSPRTDYWCWGYSFPWQTRTKLVPSGAANLVCTTFVGNALLGAYEVRREPHCLMMASSAAEYLIKDLYWSAGESAGFSYPLPSMRNQVHNANFLAAAFLCRVYKYSNDEALLQPALKVARYSASKQRSDGSWLYGEGVSQQWIDNFHTGYNLCALQTVSAFASPAEFDSVLKRGFNFYRKHFFREDGSVRYFHDQDYPIDIHCVAQSILTLVAFQETEGRNLQLAHSVLQWALAHLWDSSGFFYYQTKKHYTSRVPYMRWSQAWMLLASVALLMTHSIKTTENALETLAESGR